MLLGNTYPDGNQRGVSSFSVDQVEILSHWNYCSHSVLEYVRGHASVEPTREVLSRKYTAHSVFSYFRLDFIISVSCIHDHEYY